MDEAVLDELYSAPLDEFIARRTALAKQLKAEGRTDEAAEVGGAKKPSVPLWTVNQLARRNKPAVDKLLDASDALRKALGTGDQDAFAAAQTAQTDSLRKLRDAARSLHGEATDAMLERVVSTFRTAAAEDDLRDALTAGRLTEEPEASGFDALAGLSFAPGGKRTPRERTEAKPERDEDGRAERVRRATKALQEAKAETRARDREARDAERAAEKARKAAEGAAAAVADAEEALALARRR